GNTQRMDPYFTCQAYWETWDEVFKGDFVTLPRVIAFRGQKYVNGKWPGDNKNKYDYPSGLRANIAVMLNFAISGFPFWGSDSTGTRNNTAISIENTRSSTPGCSPTDGRMQHSRMKRDIRYAVRWPCTIRRIRIATTGNTNTCSGSGYWLRR
ncbi:MAG: TIM-barrel domain-containing protein, partial [Planctomycetota bacterium]